MTLSTTEFIEIRKQMVDENNILDYLPFKTKKTLRKWRDRIFKEYDSDTAIKIVAKVDSKNYIYHKDNFPMYVMLLSTKDEQEKLRGKL